MTSAKLQRIKAVSRRLSQAEQMERNRRMFEQMGLDYEDIIRMADAVGLEVDDLLLLNTRAELNAKTLPATPETFGLPPDTVAPRDRPSDGSLEIDTERFTVVYKFQGPCFLGNTIPFRLIVRLASRPGTFIHFDSLKSDVWDDELVSDETVARTARSLRAKIVNAGIRGLGVNSSQRHHVALFLD